MQCPFIPINKWQVKHAGPFKILIADTLCKRSQGLQGVPHLPKNTFMYFPGVQPGSSFHTNNCLFKMDICPVSRHGQLLDIFTAAPKSNRVGPMPPNTAAVLEAPAHWFINNGYGKGDYFPFIA
tara:strand:- start:112 stop:483 length:372 start_codon:yes stop_codon:yes gene_type:complete